MPGGRVVPGSDISTEAKKLYAITPSARSRIYA